jgi:hypothetical protein
MAMRIELENEDVEMIEFVLMLIVTGFVPCNEQTEKRAKDFLTVMRGN